MPPWVGELEDGNGGKRRSNGARRKRHQAELVATDDTHGGGPEEPVDELAAALAEAMGLDDFDSEVRAAAAEPEPDDPLAVLADPNAQPDEEGVSSMSEDDKEGGGDNNGFEQADKKIGKVNCFVECKSLKKIYATILLIVEIIFFRFPAVKKT